MILRLEFFSRLLNRKLSAHGERNRHESRAESAGQSLRSCLPHAMHSVLLFILLCLTRLEIAVRL